MADYIVGLDIGGTKIEAALFKITKENGSEHTKSFELVIDDTQFYLFLKTIKRISTLRNRGYEDVMERLSELISQLLSIHSIDRHQIQGIGVGLPGTVHPLKQIMINGNSEIFIGKEFSKDLKSLLNYSGTVLCNNDASCFALAEAMCGVGLLYEREFQLPRSKQSSIGVVLGTGCGGGLIFNNKVINGRNGGGGEIGHTSLILDGRDCYCGNRGCAEQYLSGTAIADIYNSQSSETQKTTIEIFSLQHLDPLASEVLNEHKKNLIRFLTNLTNIFDPDFFVVGGGVSKQEFIYEGLEKRLWKKVFVPGAMPRIYKHQISDSSGVLGAALLVCQFGDSRGFLQYNIRVERGARAPVAP